MCLFVQSIIFGWHVSYCFYLKLLINKNKYGYTLNLISFQSDKSHYDVTK